MIKLSILLLLNLLALNTYAQSLQVFRSTIGEPFDFGPSTQRSWNERNLLLDNLNEGKKNWDNLSKEEEVLLKRFPETYLSMWDVIGAGCSWYCGAGDYTARASSSLSASASFTYNAENLLDFSYQTAWVEGAKGDGVGEYIQFDFKPTHPRVTTIIIANGYVKSKKIWQENGRIHKLKMYVNNEPFSIIELQDVYAQQIITLNQPLGHANRHDYEKLAQEQPWSIKFEILSIYKGEKYSDTAITELYFDGIDVH